MTRSGAVVVTGADGFIGRAVCARLAATWMVQPVVRELRSDSMAGARAIGDLASADDDALADALRSAFAVVHLAGRAHVMRERSRGAEAAYRAANVTAVERVASAALAADVERFVLASSVKVFAERSAADRPFTPADPPHPRGAYGRSKLEGEQALMRIAVGTRMAPIVLRLPLVYGPGVRGNFAVLMAAVASGRMLPLGAIDNRRSLLGIDNLVDAIDAALRAPVAPAGVHCLADADAVSTPELVRALALASGRPNPLGMLPVPLLRAFGALIGKRAAVARLTESLVVDCSSFAQATGWRPRVTLEQGLSRMVAASKV